MKSLANFYTHWVSFTSSFFKLLYKTKAATSFLKRQLLIKYLVPEVGLEPTRLSSRDFKSRASADSATPAKISVLNILIYCSSVVKRILLLAIKSPTPHKNVGQFLWRRHPDLNWGWRFCRPLPYHLAMAPYGMNGAVDEIRTRDIHLGKVALYH